jgi:hypothetical protein
VRQNAPLLLSWIPTSHHMPNPFSLPPHGPSLLIRFQRRLPPPHLTRAPSDHLCPLHHRSRSIYVRDPLDRGITTPNPLLHHLRAPSTAPLPVCVHPLEPQQPPPPFPKTLTSAPPAASPMSPSPVGSTLTQSCPLPFSPRVAASGQRIHEPVPAKHLQEVLFCLLPTSSTISFAIHDGN